jgi:tetratricopeptide (TPR) repeat protein
MLNVESATFLQNAWGLNNRGVQAAKRGNHAEAERLHTEALNLKKLAEGPDSVGYALSANHLGEAQIHLGKWDAAEKNLQDAVRIRNNAGPEFDAAVSRDNLARIYEKKGDFTKARSIRLTFPQKMACSYYEVGIVSLYVLHFAKAYAYIPQCPKPFCQKRENLKECDKCQVRL